VQDRETPLRMEWRFLRLAGRMGMTLVQGVAEPTCQPKLFAVLSDLPIKRLTRATRKGQSKLAAEQGIFAEEAHFIAGCRQRRFP